MNLEKTKKLEKLLEFTSVDLSKISLIEAVEVVSSLIKNAGYPINALDTSSLKTELAPLIDNAYGGLRYLHDTINHMIRCLKDDNSKEFYIEVSAQHILTEKDGIIHLSMKYGNVVETILVAAGIACVGIPITDIKKCPSCGKVFVQRTKKNRIYCCNRCSSRAVSKKRYAALKNNA